MKIRNILVITLSNLGDVVLTTPVIKVLHRNFPYSHFVVMCSKRVEEIFLKDPHIDRVIAYDKHSSLREKIKQGIDLRKQGFDIVVDLRHTLFPLIIGSKYRTSILRINRRESNIHKRDYHLNRLKELNLDLDMIDKDPYLYIPPETKIKIDNLFNKLDLGNCKCVAISPGGRSKSKMWPKEKTLQLCKEIIGSFNCKIILIGDKRDKELTDWLSVCLGYGAVNLGGKTNILELAQVLKKSDLLITNDSGALHVGSASGVPIIALFGPTSEILYGPLSAKSFVVKKNIDCRPCGDSRCESYQACLKNISVAEVFHRAKGILSDL